MTCLSLLATAAGAASGPAPRADMLLVWEVGGSGCPGSASSWLSSRSDRSRSCVAGTNESTPVVPQELVCLSHLADLEWHLVVRSLCELRTRLGRKHAEASI